MLSSPLAVPVFPSIYFVYEELVVGAVPGVPDNLPCFCAGISKQLRIVL